MPLDRKIDKQMRGWTFAFGGSAIVAVAAMFVPVHLWEMITGSTGISEMVPAAAPPLGDMARALIAFGLGAGTFILLAAHAFRSPARSRTVPDIADGVAANEPRISAWKGMDTDLVDDAGQDEKGPSLVARLRSNLADWAEARRDSKAIISLEDLPKLRASDAHPDAPPRRPFSAGRDIPDASSVEPAPVNIAPVFAREAQTLAETSPVSETSAPPADATMPEDDALPLVDDSLDAGLEAELIEAAAIAESGEPREEALFLVDEVAPAEAEAEAEVETKVEAEVEAETEVEAALPAEGSSLEMMVNRLEAALNARDAELARIEALAHELAESAVQPVFQPEIARIIEPAPVATSRPVRGAAPSDAFVPDQAEEMDPALRAALETLHRTHSHMH